MKIVKCLKSNDYGRCTGGWTGSGYRDLSEYRFRVKKTGELLEPVYNTYQEAKQDLLRQADYYCYGYHSLEVVAVQPIEN